VSDPAYFKQMGGSNSGPDSVPVDMKGWLSLGQRTVRSAVYTISKTEAIEGTHNGR
jgi:hypothetical protein